MPWRYRSGRNPASGHMIFSGSLKGMSTLKCQADPARRIEKSGIYSPEHQSETCVKHQHSVPDKMSGLGRYNRSSLAIEAVAAVETERPSAREGLNRINSGRETDGHQKKIRPLQLPALRLTRGHCGLRPIHTRCPGLH